MEFNLTKHNPDYDSIKEKKYAFVQVKEYGTNAGAPYTDESYEPFNEMQTRIITWE